jgi:hypothetical protein
VTVRVWVPVAVRVNTGSNVVMGQVCGGGGSEPKKCDLFPLVFKGTGNSG